LLNNSTAENLALQRSYSDRRNLLKQRNEEPIKLLVQPETSKNKSSKPNQKSLIENSIQFLNNPTLTRQRRKNIIF